MHRCLARFDRSVVTSTARQAASWRAGPPGYLSGSRASLRRCSNMLALSPETCNEVVTIVRVPMFQDNYGWLMRDKSSGKVAAVDPAEPQAIQRVLNEKGWKLDYILNTHHHHDHVGGNEYLKEAYGCTIVGPRADAERIPLIDHAVGDGDFVKVGHVALEVFDTPGHTRGHITYWQEQGRALFPGDTLFALGCGRLFEGTPEQMWKSLSKLKELPGDACVFCAHEYTQANAKWAVTVDPNNAALKLRKDKIDWLREEGKPTIPSFLGEEFATNPFLRPDNAGIRAALDVPADASDEVAFAAIRKHKDNF